MALNLACDTNYDHFSVDRLDDDEKTYLRDLFTNSFCKGQTFFIRDFKKDRAYTGAWIEKHYEETFSRFFLGDMGFFPNGYKNAAIGLSYDGMAADYTPKHVFKKVLSSHTVENLYRIRTFAIDIDYRRCKSFSQMNPLTFWNMLLDYDICDKIPPISYIEYGHQIRLIYVLEEPIYAQGRGSKTALKTIKCIQKRICSNINYLLGESVADAQPLSSFYRMPESLNLKDRSVVHVFKVSEERLTFQEMLDYLPKPEWYEDWKAKKTTRTKKSKKIYEIHNTYTLYLTRKTFLEEIARTKEDINRYMLIWCYVNNELMIEPIDTLEKAKEINAQLIYPLKEKELERKIKGYKGHYRISNKRICEKIGVGEEIIMTKREVAKLEKIKAGTTRAQIAEKHYQEYLLYKEKGLTQKQIAEKMGMSIDMIKKYSKRSKLES